MTRYRFQAAAAEAAPQGRCSRCEEEFPIVALRPAYRLSRCRGVSPPAAGRMRIGMDDPTLAPRLAETGLDADRTVPMLPYAATASAPGDLASPSVPDVGVPLPDLEADLRDAAPQEEAEPVEVVAEEVEESAAPARNPAREWRVTLLFGLAGAAAGYYASTVFRLDTWQSTAGMAGAWLLLAWTWVRWVARRH